MNEPEDLTKFKRAAPLEYWNNSEKFFKIVPIWPKCCWKLFTSGRVKKWSLSYLSQTKDHGAKKQIMFTARDAGGVQYAEFNPLDFMQRLSNTPMLPLTSYGISWNMTSAAHFFQNTNYHLETRLAHQTHFNFFVEFNDQVSNLTPLLSHLLFIGKFLQFFGYRVCLWTQWGKPSRVLCLSNMYFHTFFRLPNFCISKQL